MRREFAVLLVLVVPACSPIRTIAAPAPAGALDCSLRTLTGLDYTPTRGGVQDGYIVLERVRAGGFLGVDQITERITVTEANRQLRLTVVGVQEKGRQQQPHRSTRSHAEAVLAGCANPQTGA